MTIPNNKLVAIKRSYLDYMLRMFDLSEQDLLTHLNKDRRRPLKEEDVYSNKIRLPVLKKLDQIFKCGIENFVLEDGIEPNTKIEAYFRKNNATRPLSIADKQTILSVHDRMEYINYLAQDAGYYHPLKLNRFTINDEPEFVASKVRDIVIPAGQYKNSKKFLKEFIAKVCEAGLLVLEYQEPTNKKEKTNLDGFFMPDNCIALRRQSIWIKRQIFTLAHEIGHFLINQQTTIQSPECLQSINKEFSDDEKWCNRFAAALLIPGFELAGINPNNQESIDELSEKYHATKLSIYKYLACKQVISHNSYRQCLQRVIEQDDVATSVSKKQFTKSRRTQKNATRMNIKQRSRLAASHYEQDVYRVAYIGGIIDDMDLNRDLNVSNVEKFLEEK